eukprot:NODE_429_length_7612_cov_0.787968.p6 type:complete len:257 gc:universal NODE_429_length_7612_cov_0.787968:1807-2577(+)
MTSILDLTQLAKQSICQIYLYSDQLEDPVENEFVPLSVNTPAGFTIFNEFELATIPAILFYGLKNTNDATVLAVHYIDKATHTHNTTKCEELLLACQAQTRPVYQQIQLNNERLQVLREQEQKLQQSIEKDMERQQKKEVFKSWFDDRKKQRLAYKSDKFEGDIIQLKFRVFNGSTYQQEFLKTHTVRNLYDFINHFDIFQEDSMDKEEKEHFFKLHKDHGHGFVISSMFPKQELTDMSLSLEQVGVQGMLIVEEV